MYLKTHDVTDSSEPAGVPRRLYSQLYSWRKFLDSEPLQCYDLNDNKIAKAMTKTDLNACLSESRGVL